jgi:methylated-DNA-[protein]-cysteine S-methyltransferase
MTTSTAPDDGSFDEAVGLFDDAPVDADRLARLHEQLEARAAASGLLDLAYRTTDSPFGTLLLAATDDGLVRVAFATEDHDAVLARLAQDVSPRILRTGRRLDPIARQLDEYFAGTRRTFDVTVDLRLVSGFRREVLDRLAAVPYGTTRSYAALAAAAGNPKAVRAAASACSHNPIPLVVPCHRIVRSDGTIGQYLGGTETKRSLLAMEASA